MNTRQEAILDKAQRIDRQASRLEEMYGKDDPYVKQLRQQEEAYRQQAQAASLADYTPNPVQFHVGTRG